MKIDDATASLAIMSNAGIRGSDAGTSLKTMLMRLMAPTDKAAAELKSLGISIYDSEGNMRNMTDIIGQFNAALGENATRTVTVGGATNKMANAAKSAGTNIAPLTTKVQQQQAELAILQRELAATTAKYGASSTQAQRKQLTLDKLSTSLATNKGKLIAATNAIGTYQAAAAGATTATVAMTQEQRNEALATIFGTDAIRAANIVLMGGVDSYTEMKDAVNTAGAAQELAGARTKGLAGAIDGLQSVIEGILIDVGEKFAPMLESLVRIIGDLLPMVQNLDPSLVASAAAFAAVFVAAGPVLTIIGAIVTAIGFLLSPIGLVITAIALLAAAWAGNWGDIRGKTKAAIDFLGGLFEGFKALVVGVFQAIVQFIVDRIDDVIGAINWFIDKVNDAIGLMNQLPGVSIGAISKIETLSERGGLLGIGGVETPSAIETIGPTALNIQGNVYLDSRKVGEVVWDDLKTRRLIGTQLGLVP